MRDARLAGPPPAAPYISVVRDTALAPLGSDYGFTKLHIWGPPPLVVVAFQARAALQFGYGAVTGDVSLFEKFYVGDFTYILSSRVLDLNFDWRRAPNFIKTDIAEVRYGREVCRKLQARSIALSRAPVDSRV